MRRVWSWIAILICIVLVVEAIVAQLFETTLINTKFTAFMICLVSIIYFAMVVIGVIFLTSIEFRPNPKRLAIDTTISIALSILAFSLIYREYGITLGTKCETHDAADLIYFSMVTFSTLGYGDFKPCESARLYAAAQAIYGNLHLGLVVGSAFFFAQKDSMSDKK